MKKFLNHSIFLLVVFFGLHCGDHTSPVPTGPVAASTVPFKVPELPGQAFSDALAKNPDRVSVISGAGPGGLTAAIALNKTGRFDHIIVVEKRTQFARNNTVSIQPMSYPMLKHLGLAEKFKQEAVFSQHVRFFEKTAQTGRFEQIGGAFPGLPESLDYTQSVNDVFKNDLWPHYFIELHKLQTFLAKEATALSNVVLIHGEIEILDSEKPADQRRSVRVKSSSPAYSDFLIQRPNLIVVAEGTKSKTRTDLRFKMVRSPGLENQHWCSGVVSLNGALKKAEVRGHISLVVDRTRGRFSFGIFRPATGDLFVNGKIKNENAGRETLDECMKRNAYDILKHEAPFLNIRMPASRNDIVLPADQSTLIGIEPLRAERITDGSNLVLLGDAAAGWSPLGGIGASFTLSLYPHALMTLTESLNGSPAERAAALDAYGRRVQEIIDFWHFARKA